MLLETPFIQHTSSAWKENLRGGSMGWAYIYIVPRNLFLDRLFCKMSLRIIPGIKSETM